MRILLIESDFVLLNATRTFLQREHFLVDAETEYKSALKKLLSYTYECILVGYRQHDRLASIFVNELVDLKLIQKSIVLVSSHDFEKLRISTSYSSWYSCLLKPFQISELLVQVKTLCRLENAAYTPIISYKNIQINSSSRVVYVNNVEMKLNKKEFEILHYFISRPERLIDKSFIIRSIWGREMEDQEDYSFMYSQIKNLKKKLKDHHASVDLKTIYGVGYKFE